MKTVALLPMKAISERIPGKNFREFGGKPLFKWILDTLLNIEDIDQIIINTDARKLLKENGLEDSKKILIRDRKTEICGHLVSMNLIISDDIKNVDADIYLMTHSTNPLLQKATIEESIGKFKSALANKSADSLFTVDKLQERYYDKNADPINHDPNNLVRTQDLEPYYKENSCLYLFTKESFQKTNARIGKDPLMLKTQYYESIDIDNENDWDFAEITLKYCKNKGIIK